MTSRQKTIMNLMRQLEYLKQSNVEDLMKEKRTQEIEEIMQDGLLSEELDFESVKIFCGIQYLNLKKNEISNSYCYELALYLNYSDIEDAEIFYESRQFEDMLKDKGEKLADNIAFLMSRDNLSNYSIEQLLSAEKQ